jgi:membrane fusion protein (multidrug efflux system)
MPPLELQERRQRERREEHEAAAEKGKFFVKHPRAKWILGAVALALLLGALLWWLHASVRETTDDAQIEGDVAPVAARVAGTVVSVNVDDNQQVHKGDVLAQLDPRDYQVALQKAEADLADAQSRASAARTNVPVTSASSSSQVAIAQANLEAAQKDVEAAQARLREATTKHELAAADLLRYKQLVEKDEVSRQQYDSAAAAEQSARAGDDAAQASVATAQSHVAQARAQLRAAQTAPEQVRMISSQAGAAQAEAQNKQAAVEQAKLDLEYCTVRAAVDGVVTSKSVQVGQTVQRGQPLMALVPLEDIWIVANYKENQLKNMRIGQRATIHVDAYNRDYRGHVDSFGAATAARTSLLPPENATGNYVKVVQRVPVKIVFEIGQDPDHLLRPGMSVVPTVLTK